MKLLMHTCCAPCSVYCIKSLREEGIEPTLFWYNPNIHPYTEYKARRDCLIEYSKIKNIELIIDENYGLDEFCRNVCNDLDNRCTNYCYKVRLEETAKYAKKNGYDAITTTLFVSPYQKHDELKKICEEIAKKYNIDFIYRDFRIGFREGQEEARKIGLYMQKYCGCIFSEEERYAQKIEKDKKRYEKTSQIISKKIMNDDNLEFMDIYNENKEKKDKIIRRTDRNKLNENEFTITVHCWNINSKKEILLTQRSMNVNRGGMWEDTHGGLRAGETSLEGIKRELKEELGIIANDDELTLVKTLKHDNIFRDIYIMKKDIPLEMIDFSDGEVMDAKYVSIDEFKRIIEKGESSVKNFEDTVFYDSNILDF